MVEYVKHTLANGLRVIIHQDKSTPMVATNVVYDVGSRDELPTKTGFAHLFEHLMFSGSENVPDFDVPIQSAGGENNAFTNADMTSFYCILPSANIETALWLESDRMKSLSINQKSLSIQQKVVIEEFKETCLNEPYGDLMHHMCDLAYEKHPYRWPTIGLTPDHIADATLDDVMLFYRDHYTPTNAVLVIAGNIDIDYAISLSEKWFADIPADKKWTRSLPQETDPHVHKHKTVRTAVPVPALYRGYHMPGRLDEGYYACDILSDILGNGRSSRLYQKLHKEQNLFSVIDSYISGSFDPGLFMIEGQPVKGVSIDKGRQAIINEIERIKTDLVPDSELQKIKNKIESSLLYAEVNILHKAQSLAYYEILGDADLINEEGRRYQEITNKDLIEAANKIFSEENCCEVVYEPIS